MKNNRLFTLITYVIFLLFSGFLVEIAVSGKNFTRIMLVVFVASLLVVTKMIYDRRDEDISSLKELRLYLVASAVVSIMAIIKYLKEFSLNRIYMPFAFAIIIHLIYTAIYKNKSKTQR